MLAVTICVYMACCGPFQNVGHRKRQKAEILIFHHSSSICHKFTIFTSKYMLMRVINDLVRHKTGVLQQRAQKPRLLAIMRNDCSQQPLFMLHYEQ